MKLIQVDPTAHITMMASVSSVSSSAGTGQVMGHADTLFSPRGRRLRTRVKKDIEMGYALFGQILGKKDDNINDPQDRFHMLLLRNRRILLYFGRISCQKYA